MRHAFLPFVVFLNPLNCHGVVGHAGFVEQSPLFGFPLLHELTLLLLFCLCSQRRCFVLVGEVALAPRNDSTRHRQKGQQCKARRDLFQSAETQLFAGPGLRGGKRDEIAFGVGEGSSVVAEEFLSVRQRAAGGEEVVRMAFLRFPACDCFGEARAAAQEVAVLLHPRCNPLPSGEQGFVGDADDRSVPFVAVGLEEAGNSLAGIGWK